MSARNRVVASVLLSGLIALLLPMLAAPPAWAAMVEPPGKIVFTGVEFKKAHVYVINSDGTGLTRITSLNHGDRDASWSPSGQSLVFASHRTGYWDIWVKNLSSGRVVQMTKTHLLDSQPVWSPDGSTIAFIRSNGTVAEVWLIDVATRQVRQLTHTGAVDADPAWSVNDQFVTYDATSLSQTALAYVDVSTGTSSPMPVGSGNNRSPAPSPDNATLAFVSDRSGGDAIWTLNSTNGATTQLTDGSSTDLSPSWSAYATRFVFSRASGGGAPSLFTMSSDGSNQAPLATGSITDDTNPQWMPLTSGQRAYDGQAQNNLLRALNDANTFWASDGSYANATAANLASLDPGFVWQSLSSTGPADMSVAVDGPSDDTFGVAAISNSGECFVLRVVGGTAVGYGMTPTVVNCSGSYADNQATSPDGWPV